MNFNSTSLLSKAVFSSVLFASSVAFSASALAGEPSEARVNVAHLAPFADTLAGTEVSVDVDGEEALPSVFFNQASGYIPFGIGTDDSIEGESDISIDVDVITPPGSGNAAISDTFGLDFGVDYTVAAIGNVTLQDLDFLVLEDNNFPLRGVNEALLRVVHAAPFAADLADTEVSIRLQDGTVVNGLTNVPYGADSGFFPLPAGLYNLVVATPDGTTQLIDPVEVELTPGQVITVFAVGDIINQPLGITGQAPDGTFFEIPLERGIPEFVAVPTLGTIGLFLMMGLLAFVAVRRLA